MPAKKRTNNHSKTSSPTTSTSHTHADHHPLRGQTGSIIGTRARSSSKPPPAPERTPASHPKDVVIEKEQGKNEEKKSIAPPRASGTSSTKFARFMYALASIAVVLLVWYAYGMVMLLERLKDEVGWWGVVVGGGDSLRVGSSPWLTTKGWWFGSGAPGRSEGGDLEGSLNALAEALGVDPVEVALAVRPLVPRASMTSVASKVGRTGGSEAVRVLFEEGSGSDAARTIVKGFAEDPGEGEVLD